MGILDKIFGSDDEAEQKRQDRLRRQPDEDFSAANQAADEQAIARYRYMLKTAPPETIEQAHAEAFAKLMPRQRQMVLQRLAAELPEAERKIAAQSGDDPQTMARLATRAEIRQPGTIERVFGGWGGAGGIGSGGIGFGGMLAGGFLSSLAGTVVGSYIAQQFFDNDPNFLEGNFDNPQDFGANDYQNTEENNYDAAGEDYAAGDYGIDNPDESGIGDFGDLGADFGGDEF